MPLISVIMSVYNAEDYLETAIESILNQTVKDFEFIIINDASEDSSKQILESYSQKDDRICVIDNNINLGLTKSLNIGIQKVNAKYIARMDGDDISAPNRFKYQVEFLENHDDSALVGSWFEVIDENDMVTNKIRPLIKHEHIYQFSLVDNLICHGSIMGRTEVIKESNGYDSTYRYAQDYDLWLRMMEKYKINNLPQYLYKLRIHSESVSNMYSKTQQNLAERARLNAIKRRNLDYNEAFNFSDQWANRCFYYNYAQRLKNKNILIYGAGAGGNKFLQMANRLQCICSGFLDRDQKKQGLNIEGYIIYSPKMIKELVYDYIVIASEYWKEIEDILLDLEVDKDKIIYGVYIMNE